jgi:hypothetical protein
VAIHNLIIGHTMSKRQLPQRNARTVANALIYNVPVEEEDEFENELEEDDYVNEVIAPQQDDSTVDDVEEQDDVLDEENVNVESSSDDDSVEENDNSDLLAPSGLIWTTTRSNQGRQGAHNVFLSQQGFRTGLHPQTRLEGFLVLFEQIIDITVRFTNLQGRRVGHRLGTEWHTTDKHEILAFIGLHVLSGKFPNLYVYIDVV